MAKFYMSEPLYKGSTLYVSNGQVKEADTRPAKSSRWEPPVVEDNEAVYLVEHAEVPNEGLWRVGRNLTSMNIESLRQMAHASNANKLSMAMALYDYKYPKEEQSTWEQQIKDANEFKNSGATSALLEALATAKGVTVDGLADSIISKSNARAEAQADALSKYAKAKAQIENASSLQDLPEFDVQEV